MSPRCTLRLLPALLALALFGPGRLAPAQTPALFTADTAIGAGNLAYEGHALTVRGATLTVDGTHTFHSIRLEPAGTKPGVLTHTAGYQQGGVNGCRLTVLADVAVLAGCRIDLDGKGHPEGQGPGASPAVSGGSGGAGHGGRGGEGYGGSRPGGGCLGSATDPAEFGSGAGATFGYGTGGAGGGALWLLAGGTLAVDGSITARGANGSSHGGGGSGGSLHLLASLFTGAGSVDAGGGNFTSGGYGGGGGGGRIAVYQGANTFSGSISALGGTGRQAGGAGTVFTKGTAEARGRLIVDAGNRTGAPTELRAAFWPAGASPRLVVDRKALVHPYGPLVFTSLELIGGGTMSHDAGTLDLDLQILQDAWIDAASRIDTEAKGHPEGQGPGASPSVTGGTGGAGHGGRGGEGMSPGRIGGACHGSVTAPAALGSGAGATNGYGVGGSGGGWIRLQVAGTLTVDGVLSVRGGPGSTHGGGGAGGGMHLVAGTFAGAGSLAADGGNYSSGSYGGGGGGGRIAVHYGTSTYTGAFSAMGGTGRQAGGAGTIFTKGASDAHGRLLVDGFGRAGAVTELRQMHWPVSETPHLSVERKALAQPYDPLVFASLNLTAGGLLSHDPGLAGFDLRILQDAVIDAASGVDVAGKGHPEGQGPGASPSVIGGSGGAGHGGRGGEGYAGDKPGGGCHGSITAPADLGSGAGATIGYGTGGAGGGAVRLTVGGKLTLDGTITADGGHGTSHGGGGAGGSLHLDVGALAGTGRITADGGPYTSGSYGGGGGGGRVALYHGGSTFTGVLSAKGAAGRQYGAAGTVLVKGAGEAHGRATIDNGGNLGAVTELRPAYWPPSVFFRLLVTGKADIQTFDPMTMASLTLTGQGRISHEAGRNAFDVVVLEDATIEAGGSIMADGRGHGEGTGPGASPDSIGGTGGAGHGGAGGAGYSSGRPGGNIYGVEKAPVDLGSGAGRTLGYGEGGKGGGAVRLNVVGTLTVDGTISVNGMQGTSHGGGGSGGSIYLTVGTFAGAGNLSARGGSYVSGAYGGGGGGGRIAVYYGMNKFSGTVDLAGGVGRTNGGKGTLFLQQGVAPPWNFVRNGEFETGALPPWLLAGGGLNTGVAEYDVTGLGKSRAFGVDAEAAAAVLGQQVDLVQGKAYLLLADWAAVSASGDPEGGQWEFRVGGIKVGEDRLGPVAAGQTARRHTCLAFTPAITGLQNLEIRIFRPGTAGPVRTWLDNVRIHEAAFPVLCVAQARRIGTTVVFHVAGTPNAPFFMFLSPFVLGGGVRVRWASGVWYLSPVMLTPLFSGLLSAAGGFALGLPIPNDPVLAGVELFFQGVEVHPLTQAVSFGSLACYPLIP